jgi:glycosyltransferase involved in cell wall biosynthesis
MEGGKPASIGPSRPKMLSVVIATLDSERTLVASLAALVPGATDGLISEVIVADAGSRDDTAVVADIAGCNFMLVAGTPGERLKNAAAAARAPYLLFLRPGIVLDAAWTGEARRFVERPPPPADAAVFRRGAPARLREMWSLLADALGAPPRPDQGLLIAHQFYDALGGHSDRAADPERDLIRRIGSRRIRTLAAAAVRLDT